MDIPKNESETVEFKESLSDQDAIIQCVAAFSNHKGGEIFIGVSDEGKLKPLSIGKIRLKT